MSARTFSRAIGVADNNTQNYLGVKPALPKADYLERVMLHFKSINPLWLLVGEGEPFLSDVPAPQTQTNISGKKNAVNVAGDNNGNATQHNHNNITLSDCEKERDTYKAERDIARAELAGMRQQLEMAQALIAAKEEMLTLLRGGYNRPN